MLPLLSDELSPVLSGIIYCGVITACQRHYEFDRAREWTLALTTWCERQPELVTFRGNCQVHRAEVCELSGRWQESLARAQEATSQAEQAGERSVVADAHYQEGEIHRLRGEFELAQQAYEKASELGRDLQPGLALLRSSQGKHDSAKLGLARALAETEEPFRRTKLLAASADVHLVMGNLDAARQAATELETIASRFDNPCLTALSARARGSVFLAEGDFQAALGPLRRAFFVWQRIGAPYWEARLQLQLAQACQGLGDHEGAQMSRSAARRVLEGLGANLDLQEIVPQGPGHAAGASHAEEPSGLTPRELEVLRLLATGKTNKELAVELELSERTVDRHVGNIFRKLNVTTRAAATALAYQRGWVEG
jgi:DNA-binding CsgD family transcriptional regulator